MMAEYGSIQVHVSTDPRGGEMMRTYEWIGPPKTLLSWIILERDFGINPEGVEPGMKIKIGQYPVTIIDVPFMRSAFECMRSDHILTPFVVFWHKHCKPLRMIWPRIIITLSVWNLADYHDARVPSIRDVHLYQKIQRLFSRLKGEDLNE